MKKTQLIKRGIFVLATAWLVGIGLGEVSVPGFHTHTLVAQAAAGSVDVATIQEFENALQNSQVSTVNVTHSIEFRKDILDIPNRDVKIVGNASKGVMIKSGNFSIYGKLNCKTMNTLSIVDANIYAGDLNGRIFSGDAGRYGWNVNAENVVYRGARFVKLSEGKLTFSGKNYIYTRAENAWVHDLEFAKDSVYEGSAATKEGGHYSAFYFNGHLVNGKVAGKVDVGENAVVNLKISPQSTTNYLYPAFYDKVQQVNVGKKGTLNVDAAGVALRFLPHAYADGAPALNLGSSSKVSLNGRGGGNFPTLKLDAYDAQVNVGSKAELLITGNSSLGVVKSKYQGATLNFAQAKNVEITNKKANGQLFDAYKTMINAKDVGSVSAWKKTGGDYPIADAESFSARNFSIYFGKACDSKVRYITGDLSQNFELNNYGKIALQGSSI